MAEQRRGFLMTFPVVLELPAGVSAEDADSPVWELADRIQGAINEIVAEVVDAPREDTGCHQTVVIDLEDRSSNAGRCAVCGAWTTDWMRDDRLEALRRGMMVEGRLLCEDELDETQMGRLYPEA